MARGHRKYDRDDNQPEIVRALKAVGASVQDLAMLGGDCPDLLVGYRHRNFVLEVKNPKGKNKLTDGQRRWIHAWNGQVEVVRSIEEALIVIGAGVVHHGPRWNGSEQLVSSEESTEFPRSGKRKCQSK